MGWTEDHFWGKGQSFILCSRKCIIKTLSQTTVHVGYSDWGGYIRDFKVYQHALTQVWFLVFAFCCCSPHISFRCRVRSPPNFRVPGKSRSKCNMFLLAIFCMLFVSLKPREKCCTRLWHAILEITTFDISGHNQIHSFSLAAAPAVKLVKTDRKFWQSATAQNKSIHWR